MRVLLIKPETVGIFSYTNLVDHEPLELEYLYTVLKNYGHEPAIYDRRHDLTPLKRRLKQFSPDVVCITGYTTQEKLMIKLTRLIKRFNKNIKVIIGGSHAEINYKNFFVSEADYIYHLSGLTCFIQLMDSIGRNGTTLELSEIAGICYKEEEKWEITKKLFQDPNDLPKADRTYFYKNKKRFRYLAFHPLALIKNAYSCGHSCSFCYCTNLNGGKYACRNVEDLANEIMTTDAPNIHITDDNFLTDKQYLLRFVELIREKNISKKYLIYGRADFVAENPEIMVKLSEIGLALVMVGLEARSNKELDTYNKNASVGHNEECIKVLKELGIICAGLFIVHQNMTITDFNELYKWIAERDIIPTVSIFTPMQGSADFQKYENKLLSTDTRKQDLFHCLLKPSCMSVTRFNYEYYKLSLRLFWLRRKSPLYSCINFGSFLFILKVVLTKFRRFFIV